MDLQLLDTVALSNAGEKLVLLHPSTKEELDITITLMGSDSDEYRNVIKKRFEQAQRIQAKSTKPQEIDWDEFEDKARDLLAKMTLDWENVLEDKKKITCNFENAKELYKKYPWIREQVEKFISDRSNFIKG